MANCALTLPIHYFTVSNARRFYLSIKKEGYHSIGYINQIICLYMHAVNTLSGNAL
jgi:hypothetical protein